MAPGKGIPDLLSALEVGDLSKLPGKPEGGFGQIVAGGGGELHATLAAGTYAMVCFVLGADGAPHFTKGMTGSIEVNGAENKAAFKAEDVKLTARDYAFEAPDKVKAGNVAMAFDNGGRELHEANLVKLASGVAPQQALQALAAEGAPGSGPPPFSLAGGPQAVIPGDRTQVVTRLEKGNYLIVCFVPDAANVPHVMKGMVKPLTVE